MPFSICTFIAVSTFQFSFVILFQRRMWWGAFIWKEFQQFKHLKYLWLAWKFDLEEKIHAGVFSFESEDAESDLESDDTVENIHDFQSNEDENLPENLALFWFRNCFSFRGNSADILLWSMSLCYWKRVGA